MEKIKNNKNSLLILASSGFIFSGVRRLYHFFRDYLSGKVLATEEVKMFALSFSLLCLFLGLTMLIDQRKHQIFNFLWMVPYGFCSVSLMYWRSTLIAILQLTIPVGLMIVVIAGVVITGFHIKVRLLMFLCRFFCALLLILQAIVFTLLVQRFDGYRVSTLLYNAAWVLIVYITMTETIPFLRMNKIISRYLTVNTALLMVLYPAFIKDGFYPMEEPLTKILSFVPDAVLALTFLFYGFWLSRNTENEKRAGFGKCALTVLVSALAGLVFTTGYCRVYENDPGVRKYDVRLEYIKMLRNGEYNWMEIYGDGAEGYVDGDRLRYLVADLKDGNMPVLFLYGPFLDEASGPTRIVFYDVENQKPYQVWGNYNCVYVRGYIPCDEEHEYPLIFCDGGRQDVITELIYEVRDQVLVLIAEKQDLYPHDTDEIDPEYTSNPDRYYWMGEEVTIDQYRANRERIAEGYQEIEWL